MGEWKDGSKIYTLRHNGPEHVLRYAPPRSGKGVGLVVPTMLTWPHSAVVTDLKREIYELTAGFFDFPMIDNIRLSDDQRCAIVVTKFEDPGAEITVICFPGSYASLKERPIYDDVVQDLRRTSEMLGNDATKLDR